MEVIPSQEDQYWRSVNIRNSYIAAYEALARTCIQMIFEVAAFRQSMQSLRSTAFSNSDLETEWNKHVADIGSELQEKVSFNWIDSAMKVYDRLLTKPALYKIVHEMSELHGKSSCFNHLHTMEAIVMKTKNLGFVAYAFLF
jgi:hypothetical protein